MSSRADDRVDLRNEFAECAALLRHRRLVAYCLPVPGAAHPHSGIAIGTAKVFAELVALYVCPGRDHGRVPINAIHHVTYIDGLIAKLAALASRQCFLLRRHLSQWCNGDVVLSEG